jgi:subtilisin family serine protease
MSRCVFMTLLGAVGVLAGCQDSRTPAGPAEEPTIPFDLASHVGQAVPGRYIVVLKPGVAGGPAGARKKVEDRGGRVHLVYDGAIQGFAADLSDAEAAALARDPSVSFVEPDRVVSAFTVQSPAPSWGLDRIDQRALPLSGSYNYGTTGSGVRVYIIDTGILLSHTDFGGRASFGFDVIHDGQGQTDCNGHGTHVAGTTAGTRYGVAKAARLVSVRVLDCSGFGLNSWVIAGINWINQNGVKPAVVNMSLGGGLSGALNQAVTNSIAAGFSYTIAAGNGNTDACQVSPASTPGAITVGATDISDTRAAFSNFGKCLDLFAPGVNITSDFRGGNTATKVLNGTSMSAPHVAGAAALYLQNNPTATPANLTHALLTTATTGVIKTPGTGSPNLLLFTGTVTGPVQDLNPVARFTATCFHRTCDFSGISSSDDHGITGYSWTLGDGTTATGAAVHRVYAANGSYTVRLTVTDAAGHTGSLSRTITLPAPANQAPVARFTVLCNSIDCDFDSITSSDDFGIVSRKWNFGDGKTGTGMAPSHRYTRLGTFNVTLTVTDAYGLTGKQTQQVTIGLN